MTATIAKGNEARKGSAKAGVKAGAESQAAPKAAAPSKRGFDPRALPGYVKVRDGFLSMERSACRSNIQWGQQFLKLLQSALKGKNGSERSNLRKQIVGALSADTGATDSKFSMSVKAAVLSAWCAGHGFDLASLSWSVVGFILAPLAKRDGESAGETWIVDVASGSVDSLLDCLRQFAEKPIGRDKVKETLAGADIRHSDGRPVWVLKSDKPAPQVPPQGGEPGGAEPETDEPDGDEPETADCKETGGGGAVDVPGVVANCHTPGDYAGKANSVLLACSDRPAALKALAQAQGVQGAAYVEGLAHWVVNLERDRDGQQAAEAIYKAAIGFVKAAEKAFPNLVQVREQALKA